MIRVDHVSKSRNGVRVLGPVSIHVRERSTVALVGSSGAGKSTLLRLMIGLVWPDEGGVMVRGELLTPKNALRIRSRLGYVIQEGGLFPHLSARDNAALMARTLDFSESKISARVDELLPLTGIKRELLSRYPHQLSGGERQRVSLMRALFLDPDVILLDEPFGALDVLVRAQLRLELRDVFRALAKTVVLVTHDLADAAFLADEIVVMSEGRIVDQGTLENLSTRTESTFTGRFVAAARAVSLGGDR